MKYLIAAVIASTKMAAMALRRALARTAGRPAPFALQPAFRSADDKLLSAGLELDVPSIQFVLPVLGVKRADRKVAGR